MRKPKRAKKAIKFRPELFWDVDVKTIDPQKHERYIIERVLQFGTDSEIRWLVHSYRPGVIKTVIRLPRVQINDKVKALWSRVF